MGATRTRSVMCSTLCLWTRSCGRGGSARVAGRLPPGSSSYRLKSTGWGGGVVRNLAVYFVSLSSSPALAFLCPREEWCNDVARAAAIDCCSCRHHERSRRCFLRCAALIKGCSQGSIVKGATKNKGTLGIGPPKAAFGAVSRNLGQEGRSSTSRSSGGGVWRERSWEGRSSRGVVLQKK